MYAEDSFFTLTQPGQIGLALLSLLLFLLTTTTYYWTARGRSKLVRVLLALVFFWGFVWLSPQVYYFYYLTQFEKLPLQNVIHLPPGPLDIARLMTFQDSEALSQHSQGVLAWSLIALSIWPRRASDA